MDATALVELDRGDRIFVDLAGSGEGFVGTVDAGAIDDYRRATLRVVVENIVVADGPPPPGRDLRTNGGHGGWSVGSEQQSSACEWDDDAVFIMTDGTMDGPYIKKPARDEKTLPHPRDDVLARAERIERELGADPDTDR